MRRLLLLAVILVLIAAPSALAANDPLSPQQWGLQKIQAPQAWSQSRGGGVTIAVSDTGVDLAHPDLSSKIAEGGHDYVDGGTPQDGHGHGTHVAGIAAAATDNGIGVAGVAPDAKIMSIRMLDDEGSGSSEDGAASIRLAADRGARVINLSWGPGLPFFSLLFDDPAVDAAVRYAYGQGSVVVVASGNDGNPFSDPATADVSLVVGATTSSDSKAAYSNAGPGVKIHAPGGDVTDVVFCKDDRNIWSTILPSSGADCDHDGYDTLSGTSMATPHVSGVAALVLARNPTLTARQVIDTILSTADTVGGLKRVNAAKAVASAGSPGGQPGGGSAGGSTKGGGSAGNSGGGSGRSSTSAPKASQTGAAGPQEGPGPNPNSDGSDGPLSLGGDDTGQGINVLNWILGGMFVLAAAGVGIYLKWKSAQQPASDDW